MTLPTRIGQRIHFKRSNPFGDVMTAYVTHLYADEFKPARVRSNGRSYVPHRDDYVEPDEVGT